jgi:hypothetical protein
MDSGALDKLHTAVSGLDGAGEIRSRLQSAGLTLGPLAEDDFPVSLRGEFAAIKNAIDEIEIRSNAECERLANRIRTLDQMARR